MVSNIFAVSREIKRLTFCAKINTVFVVNYKKYQL